MQYIRAIHVYSYTRPENSSANCKKLYIFILKQMIILKTSAFCVEDISRK